MFKSLIIFNLLITLVLSCFSLTEAQDKIQVKDIRHYELPQGLRVVVETSGVAEFIKGELKNPERLFFDIKNSTLNKEIKKEYLVNDSVVNKVRLGQFDINTVRIVFDLKRSDYEFKIIQLEDPFRIVIDIFSNKNIKSQKKSEEKESKITLKRKIVIDPGHGGKDPGAIGPTGLKEKDVTLDIALKLRDILKNDPLFDVVLTRDKDVFIPLNERTEIANRVGADLFISIHTNASPNSMARGIETYILNWTDDEEAIRVAARENAISIKKMKQLKDELGFMLASLEREAKRDSSVKLAGYIHNSMIESLRDSFLRNDNGVKQALFYVLVGANMPSCLLEVSYISNPEEEKLLSQETYRQQIAKSIVEGIRNYFIKNDDIKKLRYAKHVSSTNRAGIKALKNKKQKANL